MTDSVVTDSDGRQARLASPYDDEASHALLLFEGGERMAVPVDLLDRQADGTYRLSIAFGTLREGGEIVLPLAEERLEVSKQVRETGRVHLHKVVETRTEIVDEPLLREEVEIERVPIGEYVEGPVAVRQEGDVTIIPVLEEVLVVEKRLRLREELHVRRQRTEVRDPQEITLRAERIEVERLTTDTDLETGGSSRL